MILQHKNNTKSEAVATQTFTHTSIKLHYHNKIVKYINYYLKFTISFKLCLHINNFVFSLFRCVIVLIMVKSISETSTHY